MRERTRLRHGSFGENLTYFFVLKQQKAEGHSKLLQTGYSFQRLFTYKLLILNIQRLIRMEFKYRETPFWGEENEREVHKSSSR